MKESGRATLGVDLAFTLYTIQVFVVGYCAATGTLADAIVAGAGCGYLRWEWKRALAKNHHP